MTKEQALEVVLEAAGDWVNEMHEYIIPANDAAGEDTSGHEERAASIDRAIEVLTLGKEIG